MVEATIRGATEAAYSAERPNHDKNSSLGFKKVIFSKAVLLEQEDAMSFGNDEETSLNLFNKHITHLELELHVQGDFKKTKRKIIWLSKDQDLFPCELVSFDHLITKDKLEARDNILDLLIPQTEIRIETVADCDIVNLAEGDLIQLERKGYCRVDRPSQHGRPVVIFEIPNGKAK